MHRSLRILCSTQSSLSLRPSLRIALFLTYPGIHISTWSYAEQSCTCADRIFSRSKLSPLGLMNFYMVYVCDSWISAVAIFIFSPELDAPPSKPDLVIKLDFHVAELWPEHTLAMTIPLLWLFPFMFLAWPQLKNSE